MSLSLENQALKGKIDLLQMQVEIYNRSAMFNPQPFPFASSGYRGSQAHNANASDSDSLNTIIGDQVHREMEGVRANDQLNNPHSAMQTGL